MELQIIGGISAGFLALVIGILKVVLPLIAKRKNGKAAAATAELSASASGAHPLSRVESSIADMGTQIARLLLTMNGGDVATKGDLGDLKKEIETDIARLERQIEANAKESREQRSAMLLAIGTLEGRTETR